MSASPLLTLKTEEQLGLVLADSEIGNLGCITACVDVLNEHGVRAAGEPETVIAAMRRIICEAHNLRTIRKLNRLSSFALGFVIGSAAFLSCVDPAAAGDGSLFLVHLGRGLLVVGTLVLIGLVVVSAYQAWCDDRRPENRP